MKKFTIINDSVRARAAKYVLAIPVAPLHEVIIKQVKSSRSLAQNSLYWGVFLALLEQHTGHSADELHEIFKGKYLIRIFIKNPDDHYHLERDINNITMISEAGMKKEAGELYESLIKNLSTTDANIDEFNEYLKCIEHEMNDLGVAIPVKDEIYNKAMGGGDVRVYIMD